MYEVQSNVSHVQQIVNKMESVADSVTCIQQNVAVANKTTISGNTNAKNTIDQHKTMLNRLMSAFKQDVERLKTIAKEVNHTDIKVSKMYQKLL